MQWGYKFRFIQKKLKNSTIQSQASIFGQNFKTFNSTTTMYRGR